MAAADRPRTRGGDALANCPDSHAEIAAKLGVDKSLVTRWVSGARKPAGAKVGLLETLYGIPAAAWNESPVTKPAPKPSKPSKTPGRRRSAVAPPVPPERPRGRTGTDEGESEGDAAEGNNARLRRYIREGMRELEFNTDLSGVKRAEALKKLVDAQVALDRSTGANALTMQRIVAHPEFQRVVRLITEAIAPVPGALEAATKALEAAARE